MNKNQNNKIHELEQNIKKRKRRSLYGIIGIVVLFGISTTLAYFSSSSFFTNIFRTATYKMTTTEVFDSPDDWKPCETVPKTITTTNEGSVTAAVRVKLEEKWFDSNQTDITSQIPSGTAIINLDNTNEWIKDGDYYYYLYELEPGDTTSSLITSVQLKCDMNDVNCTTSQDGLTKTCESTNPAAGKKYRLTATIDTIQIDKYDDVWNPSSVVIIPKPVTPSGNTFVDEGSGCYYDPVTTNPCNSSTFSIANINNGTSTCYKWYAIEGDSNNTTLILDHNLDDSVVWASGGSIISGPNTALNTLNTLTSSWTRVSPLTYSYDTSLNNTNTGYNYGTLSCVSGVCTVSPNGTTASIVGTNQNPLRARLITGEEIRLLTIKAGAEPDTHVYRWALNVLNSDDREFVFSNAIRRLGSDTWDEAEPYDTSLAWLIDNTSSDPDYSGSTANAYGQDNGGYWTLSPSAGLDPYEEEPPEDGYAFAVDNGVIGASGNITDTNGIRPVITVPTSSTTCQATTHEDESSSYSSCTASYGQWRHLCSRYISGVHGGYEYRQYSGSDPGVGGACTGTGLDAAERRRVTYTCN